MKRPILFLKRNITTIIAVLALLISSITFYYLLGLNAFVLNGYAEMYQTTKTSNELSQKLLDATNEVNTYLQDLKKIYGR